MYFNRNHLDFFIVFWHSINYRRVAALVQRRTKLRCESEESRHFHVQTKRAYYSALDCRRWLGDNLVCNGTLRAYRLQPHVPPCSCLPNISVTDCYWRQYAVRRMPALKYMTTNNLGQRFPTFSKFLLYIIISQHGWKSLTNTLMCRNVRDRRCHSSVPNCGRIAAYQLRTYQVNTLRTGF